MAVNNEKASAKDRDGKDINRRDILKAVGGVGLAGLVGTSAAAEPAMSQTTKTPQTNNKKTGYGRKYRCKITLVQLTDNGDGDSVIARMPAFFEKAAAYSSDLIVFPEYVLGKRITVEHERVQKFFALAREYKMNAIAGLIESHGKKWATTALVADRSGNLLGRYYKCHPASGPPPHWWPPIKGHDGEARGILGNQFKVFHLDFGPIGILQCYDGYFPEAWGCTSFNGAEIILWINGRSGYIQDSFCIYPAWVYGCVIGANITNGKNTGFAGPKGKYIIADGKAEETRLFPRIKGPGDNCVHAGIDLKGLRRYRKHLRTMHQRRPELYGRLTEDIKIWQDYPDIPWDHPECAELVNKAQL